MSEVSTVVDNLPKALILSGQLVQEAIERVNCYLPKLRPGLETGQRYNPYVYAHFALINGMDDARIVADYYAYLQSFVHDFAISLPEASAVAIASYQSSSKLVEGLSVKINASPLATAEYLFIQHAELNPYLCFMRGHLSASTVVSLAVVNLQLALTYELISNTESFGRALVPLTYVNSIKDYLGLSS